MDRWSSKKETTAKVLVHQYTSALHQYCYTSTTPVHQHYTSTQYYYKSTSTSVVLVLITGNYQDFTPRTPGTQIKGDSKDTSSPRRARLSPLQRELPVVNRRVDVIRAFLGGFPAKATVRPPRIVVLGTRGARRELPSDGSNVSRGELNYEALKFRHSSRPLEISFARVHSGIPGNPMKSLEITRKSLGDCKRTTYNSHVLF